MSSTKTAPDTGKDTADEAAPKSKKKMLVMVLVGALVAAGAGYWFFLKPSGPSEPVPGEVVTLEPIQINLAEGHYLKVGIALQLTATAHELDGSKALDATIDLFSGLPLDELSLPKQRGALKEELNHELEEAYHGDVMEVYFTEFVTQ